MVDMGNQLVLKLLPKKKIVLSVKLLYFHKTHKWQLVLSQE